MIFNLYKRWIGNIHKNMSDLHAERTRAALQAIWGDSYDRNLSEVLVFVQMVNDATEGALSIGLGDAMDIGVVRGNCPHVIMKLHRLSRSLKNA